MKKLWKWGITVLIIGLGLFQCSSDSPTSFGEESDYSQDSSFYYDDNNKEDNQEENTLSNSSENDEENKVFINVSGDVSIAEQIPPYLLNGISTDEFKTLKIEIINNSNIPLNFSVYSEIKGYSLG